MNLRALSLSFVLLISLSGFSLINVPLEAQNWTDDTRAEEPVTAGVPLPAGTVTDLSKLRIVDGSGNTVPAQFKPLARWWKERAKGIAVPSVKWVLCDFQATSIAGKNKADFFLRDDNASTPASSSLSVTEDAAAITVTTGPLRFTLSKLRFNLFDEVWINGNKVVSSSLQNGGFVKAGNWSAGECVEGTVHSTAGAVPESVVVEESGSQKVMIRAQGRHYASASGVTKGLYGWTVWITAYAGKPYVDVQFVLTNTLLDGAGTGTIKVYAWPIKEWKMDLNLAGSGTWQGAFCEDALTNLDIDGKRLLQKVSGYTINGSASGTSSQGGAILTNGSTGVRISNRDFANRSPKAITLKPALLSMEWLPDTGSVTALDPYSNYNNRFRMEFFSALPSDSLTVFTRKANAPIRLLAPRSWYRDTDSWHRGFGLPPHTTFNRVAPSTWTRLEKPPTSWSKWGEIAGFNGVGDHWNLTSGFWNYLHTGKPSDFEFAEKYALYFNDVVSVQTSIGRNKDLSYWLNCEKYLPTFGSANTEDMYHQSVSSYPGWTWRRSDRPDDGHMPNLMVLEHYYLTGDPSSREAVLSQAVRAATSVYFRVYASPYGPAGDPKYRGRVWHLDTLLYYGYGPRYIGRPIIVASQGYEIYGDSLLLRPMQLYSYALRNWIRRSPIGYLGTFDTEDQGGMINTWNSNNPDVPPPLGCWMTDFQNGIATEGLYNYWQQTEDPEIHDALIFSGKSFEWRAAKDSTGYKGFIYGGWNDYLSEGKRYASGSFESSANEGFGGLIFGYLACGRPEIYGVVQSALPGYVSMTQTKYEMKTTNFWAAVNKHDSLDAKAPAAIKNLSAVVTGSNSVRLSWTAPGNDSVSGKASYYRVKVSQTPIVDFVDRWDRSTGRGWPDLRIPLPYSDTAWINKAQRFRERQTISFWGAKTISGAPIPLTAGTSQTFDVSSLPGNGPWYFSIVTFDSSNNASGVSNCAFASESVVSSQFIFPDTLESELTIKIRSLISYSNGKIDSTGNAMFYRLIQGDAAECDFEGIVKGKSGRQGLIKIEAARGFTIIDTLTMVIVPSTAICDSIQLNAKSLKICVRDTFRLYAVKTFFTKGDQHFIKTSLPGDTFQWTVSDTSILSAKSGSLIGKKAGTVVVTTQFMASVARCSVVVRPRPSVLMRLDFRCDTLSPSFGWLPVGGARGTYSSAWGYGWTSGSISCRSNRSSHFLITSINTTSGGRFKVNVPAGNYVVRSALGDWAYPPTTLSEFVIYQGDTLCGHLTAPGSRQTIRDDTIFVTGDTGAVFDIKGNITYMVIISNEGIPMSLIADDSVETTVPPIGVENGIASSVIVTASLHSAPNPFNPSVNITIDLPQNVYAVYRIVDMNGRLMYHTNLRAGVHGTRSRILWNGCDKNGTAVSAGCYFGLLTISNKKNLTHKLLFLK